ncbi:MAG: hypothetical protein AAGH71_01085 [Planctomycetota bacterium]
MKVPIIACAIAAHAGVASAQLTIFTDRSAWEAAVGGGIFTEDFNALAPQTVAEGATLDTGLIQITRDGAVNPDGDLAIEVGAAFGNIDATTFISGETGETPHEVVDIAFGGQSIFAFGADWFSPFSGDGIALDVGGEIILLDSIAGFDIGFVGFVSASASFSEISIVGNPAPESFQELWSADNFSFAVPTPGTAVLLGLGGLAAARRRR